MNPDSIDKIRQVNNKRAELETKERQHKEQLDRSASLESVLFHSFQSLVSVLEGNGDKAEAIAMVVRALDKLDKEGTDNKAELATVKAGLTELESQLKDIPTNSLKQLPKFLQQRDVIKVTNLSDLDKGFAQVEQAIKGMKLTAEAPQVSVKAPTVNVPAPIVNVPETDLKPLQSAMMDVVKAVKAVKMPEASIVDLSKLEKEAKTHTKLLGDILDKPTGGGGGGGQAWTAVNTAGIPMPLNLDIDGKLITTSTGGGGGVQYTEDVASAGGETGTVALGVRRDADTSPVSADGDFHTPIYDNAGAQKVNVKASALPTGASTAAKQPALGTAGTPSADIITVQGVTSMTPIKTDGSGVTQPVSGTLTANAGTNLNTSALALDATLTGGTQQSKITDGTNLANVLKSDGTVAAENSQLVAPAVRTITFTTSSSGVQTILANTDVSHYAWIEVVYTSVGSGLALTGQFSTVSGGTYVNQSTFASNTGSPNGALGTTVSTVYTSPIRGNFFQIAVSALTSGTFTGTVTLRATPQPFITALASSSQSGTWTVGSNSATGSAVPANAFYQAGNVRTSSPTAASNANLVGYTANVMGEQLVATGGLVTTAVAVSASNTVVKATAGRLCQVLVTTVGATAMQIFDNATTNSGTIIGQLPASAAVGSIYQFNMPAANGITVAGSATNPAVTVSWI